MKATPYRWKPGVPTDRHRRRFGAKAAAQLIKALQGTPTMHELVAESGLCIHTDRSYVKALHLAGAIRIVGWEPDKRGAYSTPRWNLGAGEGCSEAGARGSRRDSARVPQGSQTARGRVQPADGS